MMNVCDCMTRDVTVVGPNDTLQQAAKVMGQLDCGVLPVGENDRLVGMITDRDIAIRAVAEGKDPVQTRVRDVMTREVKYVFDDDLLSDATDLMAELQLRRLPVISREKRLVGIISLGDVAREDEPRQAGEALQGISRPGGPHTQSQA
jgi:CBS domain-containing protein